LALGAYELPLGAAIELELIVEIASDHVEGARRSARG
jgi:hypothetical protein